jgi:hypothetical protein
MPLCPVPYTTGSVHVRLEVRETCSRTWSSSAPVPYLSVGREDPPASGPSFVQKPFIVVAVTVCPGRSQTLRCKGCVRSTCRKFFVQQECKHSTPLGPKKGCPRFVQIHMHLDRASFFDISSCVSLQKSYVTFLLVWRRLAPYILRR